MKLKKLTTALLISIMAISGLHIGSDRLSAFDVSNQLSGDVDLDGTVNINDVVTLQKYLVNNQVLGSMALQNADYNSDGNVDVFDAVRLRYNILKKNSPTEPPTEPDRSKEYVERIVEQVNKVRTRDGIDPVTINWTLTDAAMLRAKEISEYFSHDRPDGSSYPTIFNEFGIDYYVAAENIQGGASTPVGAMNMWLTSMGSRAYILDPDFTEIGVGYYYDPDSQDQYYWTQLFINTDKQTYTPTEPPTPTEAPTEPDRSKEYVERIAELVNEERAKKNLSPVTINWTLTDAAMLRAKEISEEFSHTRPDGTKCWTALEEYNISYMRAAENIAAGSSTPEATMNQWINSEGHYNNLMKPDVTEIGVGYYYDPGSEYGYYWSQFFIG